MSTGSTLFFVYLGTLLLPVLYGLLAWRRVAPLYKPMLVFIWVVFVLQVLESFFQLPGPVKIGLLYLEPLIGWALITWQAKRLGIFERRPGLFWLMLSIICLARIAERLWWHKIPEDISWISVTISFMIILMAIEMLNRTMIRSTGSLIRNPIILFSTALIFYYTFSVLLDVFMIIGQYSGKAVLYKSFYFYMVLGICTNIIYLRSFVCIPTKTNYSIS